MRLITALFAALLAFMPPAAHAAEASAPESAYDRIMKTGTIRCGYVVWAPYLLKDPNTGAMSGLSLDYMNAIAKELDLKLEWTEEVGWGTFQEGLNTGRYDLMCVPVWQSGQRAKLALLSRPLFYNTLMAYSRADDHRFDTSLESANMPDVRIVVQDGDVTQAVRQMIFPRATEMAQPQNNDGSLYLMNVASNKADIVLASPTAVSLYNQNADVKLHSIAGGTAIRRFGNSLAMKQGEFALKAMLDATIEAVNTSGEAAHIVASYAPECSPIAMGYAQ